MRRTIILFFFVLIHQVSAGEKCAFIVTHEREKSIGNSNMPIETQDYIEGLQHRGWSIQAFYDQKLRDHPKQPNFHDVDLATSSAKDIQEGAKKLEEKKCDQVLVIGVAHGSCGIDHGWSLEEGSFPIKFMIPTFEKLRAKGSKIAVIDQSCYSGNSIDILDKYADCVMATSGRYQKTFRLGAHTLSDIFKLKLKEKSNEKVSLHEIFLRYACSTFSSPLSDISSLKIGQPYLKDCTTDWGNILSQTDLALLKSLSDIGMKQILEFLKKMGCDPNPKLMKEIVDDLATSDTALFLLKEETGPQAVLRTFLKETQESKNEAERGCFDFFLN